MKKYYLHNGVESSGPFDIEELKAKKITKSSLIWFEGMLHWKTAGEIPELTQLFLINPPPFPLFETPTQSPKIELKKEARKILGLQQNVFFISCVVVMLLVGITFLKNIEEKRSRELRIKNHKTEVENFQLEQKQKQQEEQKIQAVIQEKIDAERVARLLSQNAKSRLIEIQKLLADYRINLEEAEKKLLNTDEFKVLRTAAEKKEQIDLLQKNIDSFKTTIDDLTKESDQLKLKMEKIPQ